MILFNQTFKVMTNVLLIISLFLSSIFSFNSENESKSNSDIFYSCTSPNAIRGIIFDVSDDAIFATAGILGNPDGFEWEINGGFICNSATNTQTVSLCPECDDPYTGNPITITVSVRAYNNGSNGTKCYGPWKTDSFVYDGPCFFLY